MISTLSTLGARVLNWWPKVGGLRTEKEEPERKTEAKVGERRFGLLFEEPGSRVGIFQPLPFGVLSVPINRFIYYQCSLN